ncbi:hypothetical protein AB0N19_32015, partial [Streptomyces sp. NPDC051132]
MDVRSRLAAVGTEPETWVAAQVGGALEAVFEAVAATRADTAALLRRAKSLTIEALADASGVSVRGIGD